MKNIIFDWSGTLINNQHTMYRAVRRIFLDYKKPLPYKTFVQEFRQPLHGFYTKHLPGTSGASIKRKLIRYYANETIPRLFQGMLKQLLLLKKTGPTIFIFSSLPQKLLEREVLGNKLSGVVEGAIGGVDDKKVVLKKFIAKNRFKKEDTCYVGDMIGDIHAAKAAGIQSIAVGWGYHKEKVLKHEKPTMFLQSPNQISKLFSLVNKSKSVGDDTSPTLTL